MVRNVQVFGLTKEGYLRLVNLLIKVYPLVNNKVVIVGFLQHYDKYDLIPPPLSKFENREFQYIMTDSK